MKLSDMNEELYLRKSWSEIQGLIEEEGFEENVSFLARGNTIDYTEAFVNKNWYDSICYQDYLDSVNK